MREKDKKRNTKGLINTGKNTGTETEIGVHLVDLRKKPLNFLLFAHTVFLGNFLAQNFANLIDNSNDSNVLPFVPLFFPVRSTTSGLEAAFRGQRMSFLNKGPGTGTRGSGHSPETDVQPWMSQWEREQHRIEDDPDQKGGGEMIEVEVGKDFMLRLDEFIKEIRKEVEEKQKREDEEEKKVRMAKMRKKERRVCYKTGIKHIDREKKRGEERRGRGTKEWERRRPKGTNQEETSKNMVQRHR